ncbi:MAG: hypothetical protein WC868_02340 [Bacteroidales bacterium]
MDKITHSYKNITPYGGLNFIYQAMNRMGLDKFIPARLRHSGVDKQMFATFGMHIKIGF